MKPIALCVVLAATLALAAPPQAKKPASGAESSAVMKGLVKDATDIGSESPKADPNAAPPPDVTKMPFTQDSVKTVMAYHYPKIQACYEETLASKGKVLEGKLLTSFVVTAEGMVKDAKILKKTTTLRDPKLHDCVVAVLSTMTFPKPPDARDRPIEFPFNLKAIR